eukprot:GSChrysophyteH1.ASY1.ANO1.38.1 assembled CDS
MSTARKRSVSAKSRSRSQRSQSTSNKHSSENNHANQLGRFSLDTIPLYATKLMSQFLLTTINVCWWWIPLHSDEFAQNDDLLSLASCFSGGVFLCLAITHLLPHAVGELEDAKEERSLGYLGALFGYFLVLYIDKVAFSDTQNLLHGSGKGGGYSSAVVLLFAMGVHSLLETVALGMAKDSSSTMMMAASIGLHQPAETLALLVAFLKTGMEKDSVVFFLLLFSCIGPAGVSLGIYLKGIASQKTDALVMAVTAGTFVYMGATEMVGEEFSGGTREEKYYRFGAIVTGAVTILLLTQQSDKLEKAASA